MDSDYLSLPAVSFVDKDREEKIIRKTAMIRKKYGSIAKFFDAMRAGESDSRQTNRKARHKVAA